MLSDLRKGFNVECEKGERGLKKKVLKLGRGAYEPLAKLA